MSRFYFDIRDGDRYTPDHEGADFDGIEAARAEAGRTLGEIARDVLSTSVRRDIAINVRDDDHKLRLRAGLRFDVTRF